MESVLIQISKVIESRYLRTNNNLSPIQLMSGKLGIALFAAYYYDLTRKELFQELYIKIIDESIEYISHELAFPDTFARGLSGVAWTIHHFMENGWIEKDETIMNEFDKHLKETGLLYLKQGNYDFLHGGLGVGLYWLDKKNGVEMISKFIDTLYETRIDSRLGIYWINNRVSSKKYIGKEVNFSLSHGMSSILVFLAKASTRGIKKEKCRTLIKGIIRFISEHAFNEKSKKSLFPKTITEIEGKFIIGDPSRLSWCYGDLGISIAFLQAGEAIKDDEIIEYAKQIAIQTTKRKSEEETGLIEGHLCHGFFGVAHVYEKINYYKPNDEFKMASNYWFNKGLKYIKEANSIQNYKYLYGKEWVSSDSLLVGISGIGLSIIDKIRIDHHKGCNWDRCLLLS